jgi:acyl-CoA synthetase (AMP-forming)/AMP-acid ligase II
VTVEVLTAAEAEPRQRRAAGALRRSGLTRGDRVVFCLPGSGDLLCAALGALRSGVVPVLLNPALLPAERALLVADADPALCVQEPAELAALTDGPEADLAPWPLARPMHYTSGTTGTPKGVWSGLLDDADAAALLAEERELWGFEAADVHLVCSPLHHSAPLRFAGGTLLAGGAVLLPGPFEARTVLAVIGRQRPTTTFCVPAHLQRLFAAADRGAGLPDLSSFRLLAHAGAPCPPGIKERAVAELPADSVWEFYGSTEGQFTSCSTAEWRHRPGSVGRARPHRTLAVDGDGVIWCEVPSYARFEYWRAPEKTARAWNGEAFSVGDLGRLDGEGYLYLDGRRDDLIITGGVNVYPVEVEAALSRCPGVSDVAVFGVPDERWGHRVCAAVVGNAAPAEVEAWARERLAAYKRPKQIFRIGELPRTSTGKVRRLDLPRQLDLPG